MSKTKKLADQLAALRTEAVNDDPHSKTTVKEPRKAPAKPQAPKANKMITGKRERMGINLTAEAVEALRQIELFLMTECDAKSTNHSAAICIALELTATDKKENKDRIKNLYESLMQSDGRRRNV
ncbi:MAG: hypothetical protein L3K26_00180 [Candidatus Hydrogenedentes bacterium]|nr:hypothetical protein [Candidatus Hydrogenedentota bacterium]